jgi:ferric-dicitrate binding protein FerR (iron transport regulator)
MVTLTRGIDAKSYIAWTRGGTLVFEGIAVREALASIGRWYDLDLQVGDSTLAERQLVVTLSGQSPTDALQLLSLALDARYTRAGRTVTFQRRR